MALHGEYYDLIWQGLKTHEFRRRFLEGRAVRWFVYLNAPISRLAPVIDLAPAVVGSPEEIARIAERMRPGNGASVMSYVQDLERAYALPILSVTEYPGLSTEDLRAELGAFHPPQGYIRLTNHPELLAVCARIAADAPIRSITVDHRLYRVRRGCRADPGGWLPWLTARRAPPWTDCPLRKPREAWNWTLTRVVKEIDLHTPGGHSGVTPSMLSGWEGMSRASATGRRCVRDLRVLVRAFLEARSILARPPGWTLGSSADVSRHWRPASPRRLRTGAPPDCEGPSEPDVSTVALCRESRRSLSPGDRVLPWPRPG